MDKRSSGPKIPILPMKARLYMLKFTAGLVEMERKVWESCGCIFRRFLGSTHGHIYCKKNSHL